MTQVSTYSEWLGVIVLCDVLAPPYGAECCLDGLNPAPCMVGSSAREDIAESDTLST